MDLFWRLVVVVLISGMLVFIYRVVRLLTKEIPSLKVQYEEGNQILRKGIMVTDDEKEELKEDFNDYFLSIKILFFETIFEYSILNFLIFLLFLIIFSYIPVPEPGPHVVPKSVVSAVLTFVISIYGWLPIILNCSASAALKEDIFAKYVILDIYNSD